MNDMKVTASDSHLQRIYQERLGQSYQANTVAKAKEAQHSTNATQDTVELSEFARRMQQEVAGAEGTSAERLAQLQERVQADTYQVPLAQLTLRLLSGNIF